MIYPEDLKETAILLLTDDLKNMEELKNFTEIDDEFKLIDYHFGLGMALRNHYKLWVQKNLDKYLEEDEMFIGADDVSFKFMKKAQELIKMDM